MKTCINSHPSFTTVHVTMTYREADKAKNATFVHRIGAVGEPGYFADSVAVHRAIIATVAEAEKYHDDHNYHLPYVPTVSISIKQ